MTRDYVIRDKNGRYLTGNRTLWTGATEYYWTDSRGLAYTYTTRADAEPDARAHGGLVTAYDAPDPARATREDGPGTLDLFA